MVTKSKWRQLKTIGAIFILIRNIGFSEVGNNLKPVTLNNPKAMILKQ